MFGAGREMSSRHSGGSRCSSGASRRRSGCIRRSRCSCATSCGTSSYGDCVVPAGELALVSPAAGPTASPRSSGTPDRYDPDRFGPARQEDRVAKYALIAFGGGPPSVHRDDLRLSADQGDLVRRCSSGSSSRSSAAARRPTTPRSCRDPRPCRVRYRRRPAGRRRAAARGLAWGAAVTIHASRVEDARNLRQKVPGSRASTRPLVRRGVRPGDPARAGGRETLPGQSHRRVPRHRRRAARTRGPLRPPPAQALARRGDGCVLTCAYHGWSYGEDGRARGIPHDRCGRPMPSLRIAAYPVQVRYGLVWLFPGDPARRAAPAAPATSRSSRAPTRGRTCPTASPGARTTRWSSTTCATSPTPTSTGASPRSSPAACSRARRTSGGSSCATRRRWGRWFAGARSAERAGDLLRLPVPSGALRVVRHRRPYHVLDVPAAR